MKRPMKTALILLSAAALLVGIALPAVAKELRAKELREERVFAPVTPPSAERTPIFIFEPVPPPPPPPPSGGGGTSGGGTSGGGGTIGTLDRPVGGELIQCWNGAKYVSTPSRECSSDNTRTSAYDVPCDQTKSHSQWSATRSRNGYSKGEACHRAAVAACKAVYLAVPTSGTSCGEPTVCVITKTNGGRSYTSVAKIETSRDDACHKAARVACRLAGFWPPLSGTGCGPTLSRPEHSFCTTDPGYGSITQCRTRTVYEVTGRRPCIKYGRVYRCVLDDDGTFDCGYFYIPYRWRCPVVTATQVEDCICNCPRCGPMMAANPAGAMVNNFDGDRMSRAQCNAKLKAAQFEYDRLCSWHIPAGWCAEMLSPRFTGCPPGIRSL